MPLLAYCVFPADAVVERPQAGVAGQPVEEITQDDLRCWYSRLDEQTVSALRPRRDGIAFHRVIEASFAAAPVIPFRFPNRFEDAAELQRFLQSTPGFAAELRRLQDVVQMEARIVPQKSEGPGESGTEYLRVRQTALHAASSAATTAQEAVADLSREWRQRGTQNGIRCFALVARDAVEPFRQRLKAAPFEKDVQVTISGPWPATEFFMLTEPAASDKVEGAI